MWRVEVIEIGRTPLPPIDIDGEELLIGSAEGCQLRLPARAVRGQHLQLRRLATRPLRLAWIARHPLELDGEAKIAGASGEAAEQITVVLGGYRLQISEAEASSVPTSPQRTESLVRELVRNIMGGAPPRLVVEEGPAIGSSRTLAPPDSRLTVGRGDEADWVILDEELSRVHAALVRTWDGVRVVDLGSKNGTLVDGEPVPPGEQGRALRDGARLTFGDVVVRYHDEAETYLLDEPVSGSGDDAARSSPSLQAPSKAPPSKAPSKPPSSKSPALAPPTSSPKAPAKSPSKASSKSPSPPPSGKPAAPAAAAASRPASAAPAAPAPAASGSALLIGLGLAVAIAALSLATWLLTSG